MTDPKEPSEAERHLEVLKEAARKQTYNCPCSGYYGCVPCSNRSAAIAYFDAHPRVVALKEGEHVYTSRFETNDDVWFIDSAGDIHGPDVVTSVMFFGPMRFLELAHYADQPESDCFPTRELAQEEADRRNGEASK